MKTPILLFAVAAFAAAVTVANADNAFLSPRAQQMQNEFRKVPGSTSERIDRSFKTGSPRAIAYAESLRKVAGTTEDKLVRYNGTLSPRALANEPWRSEQFQVAPLK